MQANLTMKNRGNVANAVAIAVAIHYVKVVVVVVNLNSLISPGSSAAKIRDDTNLQYVSLISLSGCFACPDKPGQAGNGC